MKRDNTPGRAGTPVRMCVICHGRFAKGELTRYVLTPQGREGLVPDLRGNLPGRGHYLCANPECAEKFLKYSWRTRRRRGGSK